MKLADIIAKLRAHPDAARPSADGDPARARGFLGLTVHPSGSCSVLYHWGRRSFANIGEVEAWLSGETPRSWQL